MIYCISASAELSAITPDWRALTPLHEYIILQYKIGYKYKWRLLINCL